MSIYSNFHIVSLVSENSCQLWNETSPRTAEAHRTIFSPETFGRPIGVCVSGGSLRAECRQGFIKIMGKKKARFRNFSCFQASQSIPDAAERLRFSKPQWRLTMYATLPAELSQRCQLHPKYSNCHGFTGILEDIALPQM